MCKKTVVKLILNTIRKKSISEDFINKHRIRSTSFTRKRKLTFHNLILFILGNSKTSLSLELSRFINHLKLPTNAFITKQAFSKARQKISYSAFVELFKTSVNIILEKAKINTYKNYRLVAVDGTTIQVPDTQENKDYFGFIKAHNSNPVALARATILYDVLNDLIIDGKLVHYNTSERNLRVIRIPLTSGETEILVTNIYDEKFQVNDFKQLYHTRWGIETKYNEIKHKYT